MDKADIIITLLAMLVVNVAVLVLVIYVGINKVIKNQKKLIGKVGVDTTIKGVNDNSGMITDPYNEAWEGDPIETRKSTVVGGSK